MEAIMLLVGNRNKSGDRSMTLSDIAAAGNPIHHVTAEKALFLTFSLVVTFSDLLIETL